MDALLTAAVLLSSVVLSSSVVRRSADAARFRTAGAQARRATWEILLSVSPSLPVDTTLGIVLSTAAGIAVTAREWQYSSSLSLLKSAGKWLGPVMVNWWCAAAAGRA